MGIPIELVTPQAWKKLILAGTPKDKDASIAYCRRAFPNVPLIPLRYRVPHDGIADSLCLLQYGLRTFSVLINAETLTQSSLEAKINSKSQYFDRKTSINWQKITK
jgi:hypothetical protein